MHHIMAFAKMILSDSQSMTIEGAILGTPSIRCNSFVGRISCMEDLEHKYELTYGFQPEQTEQMVSKIFDLLHTNGLEEIWHHKKEQYLSEKQDMTRWMIDYFEKEISKKGA
jgi:predicted glycosyltransferase